jgi:hypothetical protein
MLLVLLVPVLISLLVMKKDTRTKGNRAGKGASCLQIPMLATVGKKLQVRHFHRGPHRLSTSSKL